MPNHTRSGGVTGESARARRNREEREANPAPPRPRERVEHVATPRSHTSFDWAGTYSTWARSNGAWQPFPGSSVSEPTAEDEEAHEVQARELEARAAIEEAEHMAQEQDEVAGDENFALSSAEPIITAASVSSGQFSARHYEQPVMDEETGIEYTSAPVAAPPEDPMVEHESDSHAIRYFRSQMRNLHENHPDLSSMSQVLTNLTRDARQLWVQNGGRRPEPPRQVEMPRRRNGGPTLGSTLGLRRRESENSQTFFGNIPETATMTTVASNFGMRVNYPSIEKHPLIVGTNLAGVEIELENITRETPSFRYWTAKGDGSLRNNGMEFVCSHPWGGVDLYNAAVEIDGFLFNDGNAPDTSWRCSTHVHIDVRDMTAAQVKKMILAYVFYERVLFRCSGWQRYKNNFCVALGFAQGQLEDLGNWWAESDSRFLHNLTSRWDKYTAINFLPMGNFGSIEFRISEAKWHKGQLIRLTNRFLSLKEVAMANNDMSDEDFVNMLMQADPADIIKKGIPKGLGNVQEDLEFGFKLAHDILSLARLRRRSRRLFAPDFEDGSRIVTTPRGDLFMNGWNHCVSHLRERYPNLEFFDIETVREGDSYRFTFNWLAELQDMMRRHRLTFELEWFLPQQNRSQITRLWNNFINSRVVPEQEAPRTAPHRQAEPFFDEEDEPIEDDSDEVEW